MGDLLSMDKRGLVVFALGAALLVGCTSPKTSGAKPAAPAEPVLSERPGGSVDTGPAVVGPPPQQDGHDLKLTTLWFADATHGWVGALPQNCGSGAATNCQGHVFHTADGGATWHTAYLGDVAPLALQLNPNGTGWLAGAPASAGVYTSHMVMAEGKLLHTTDGGRTWAPLYSDVAAGGAFLSVSFTGTLEGWIGTATGRLLHTGDGGKTWEPGNASCANWVSFVSPLEGFAFCGFPINPGPGMMGKGLLRTTDGGTTWQVVQSVAEPDQVRTNGLPLTGYGAGFAMRTTGDGWIALSRGGLLHTSDGGNTWTSQLAERAARSLPPVEDGRIDYSDARAVQFLSGTHGYALMGRQYVVETTDGGISWRVLLDAAQLPPEP